MHTTPLICLLLLFGSFSKEVESRSIANYLTQKSGSTVEASDSRESKILKTVFDYQITNCHKNESRKVYFLSYKGTDPPNEVMERFKRYGNAVRKRSALSQFYEQRESEVAVVLAIESIDAESDLVVNVRAACRLGTLDGSSYLYRVVYVTGKWKVMKRTLIGLA